MDLLTVMGRTLFFYFFILLCYRIMGKREIAQLSISDLTISILIAELVAISIENRDDNTLLTILPIVLLVGLEVILAFIQLKSNGFREFLDGKPSLIVDKGKLNFKEMVKQRYSVDDLLIALRSNQIKSIDEVDYAILETNGKLSIFKKNIFKMSGDYPLPLVIDGKVDYETLRAINKTGKWLTNRLTENDLSLDNLLYAFYKKNTIYVIKKEK
ncbi:MAG TPA: hypothetical protein DCE23_08845 [Firmicutes bacterium]|nr:hypothetical protein [Bacillota bacterium]